MINSVIKIKRVSLALAVILVCALVYWFFDIMSAVTPFIFTDKIYETNVIQEGVVVTLMQRVAYGAVWYGVIGLGLVSGYFGVKTLWSISRGRFFDKVTTVSIQRAGLFLTASMIGDLSLMALVRMILSFNNPDGMVGLEFYFVPSSVFMLISGLAFALIGTVFSVAYDMQVENESFV